MGIPNARAKWFRSDGQPLPRNSYEQRNGQLVIENVQASDGGRYECRAIDSSGRVVFTLYTILTIRGKP